MTENNKSEWLIAWEKAEKEAQELYQKFQEEDKDKDYKDILPSIFKTFKRSIICTSILKEIDKLYNVILERQDIYPHIVSKSNIVRWLQYEDNYKLKNLFMPSAERISNRLYMDFCNKEEKENKDNVNYTLDGVYERFEEQYKDLSDRLREIDYWQCILKQDWGTYLNKENKKKGELDPSDLEDSNYPRLSRGNLCYYYIPIKGLGKDESGGITCLNPRTKKKKRFTIINQLENDYPAYKCVDGMGKECFIADWEEVNEAWDCLFSINKEIYSGWWNKTLIKC